MGMTSDWMILVSSVGRIKEEGQIEECSETAFINNVTTVAIVILTCSKYIQVLPSL